MNRRAFLTSAATSTLALTAFAAAAGAPVVLCRLDALRVAEPLATTLPDGTPVAVVRLGAACTGGVGPDGDVVAFVPICTHLGCAVAWIGGRFVCPCHRSQFDASLGGQCFQGPASAALPRLRLRIDGDDVVTTGIEGVVWSHPTAEPA